MRPDEKTILFDLMAHNGNGLNEWEKNFVIDVYVRWARNSWNTLTRRQKDKLKGMHTKVKRDGGFVKRRFMAKIVELRGQHWSKFDSGDRIFILDLLAAYQKDPNTEIPRERTARFQAVWDRYATKEVAA